ncbi:MAG: serine/threonine protein kinase [Myxococcales bacterium]|nr:serine/threonine protein kinase [Myxococcales bacterium]
MADRRAPAYDGLVTMDELTFGRYRATSVINHGRTGVVYHASFAGGAKKVALKALDPLVCNDLVLRERFIRGARATSLVCSPHLATIYEVGVQMPSGQVWCAMELIEGRSLAVVLADAQLRGDRFPQGTALHIAKQLCSALAAVHAGGVIHRNVKPANVMLATRGMDRFFVRLVGFSLVKLNESDGTGEELTARGAVVGTPAYMAPEALVDSSQVDRTADIYSLGVVMYEMLTGRLPYGGASTRSVIDQLIAKQAGPPPLGIEPLIDELLTRMLSPDRALRPVTADDVLGVLAMSSLDEDGPTSLDLTPAAFKDDPLDTDSTLPGKRRLT